MTIQELLKGTDFEAIYNEMTKKVGYPIDVTYEQCEKQFDVTKHEIYDTSKREDKIGEKEVESNGVKTKTTFIVNVTRIGVAFQNLITNRIVSFLLGGLIRLNADAETDNQKTILKMIQFIWDARKLDYKNNDICTSYMSECETAELWYFTLEEGFWNKFKNKIKVSILGNVKLNMALKILSPSRGDKLYPHNNETGNMDAFGRWYSILDSENKSIEHFDIYTSEYIYKYIKKDKWDLMDPPAVNLLAAIPIIYYYRRRPLCNDINDLVKRFAETISNFCDTNDYFGSPTLVINGTVISLADKKNSGKVIQLEGQATANYLIWPQAPESIKLELSTLKELIFTMVQCADISFEQMKGLGGASGIAIERMLTDIYLKCNMEERKFGEGIQRRLNLFKEAIGNIIAVGLKNDADNMAIKPIFNYYKPNNIADLVQMLTNANGGKPIVSQKTAVGLSPLTQDPAIELEQIQAEESASIDTNLQPASFNP